MPAKKAPLTQNRVQYRRVTLQGTVETDFNGVEFILGQDGQGFQYKVTLSYLPPNVQISDLVQGQVWWIDNSTSAYTWSLQKSVGEFTSSSILTLEDVYPVGSIYFNASSSHNPSTIFGFGTWSAFGPGRTLISVGSNGTDNFPTSEATGGSSSALISHAHGPGTLGTDTFSHHHTAAGSDQWAVYGTGGGHGDDPDTTGINNQNMDENLHNHAITSGATDLPTVSTTATSLPPYITCYMWIRTS